jgi:hypothetical protein
MIRILAIRQKIHLLNFLIVSWSDINDFLIDKAINLFGYKKTEQEVKLLFINFVIL